MTVSPRCHFTPHISKFLLNVKWVETLCRCCYCRRQRLVFRCCCSRSLASESRMQPWGPGPGHARVGMGSHTEWLGMKECPENLLPRSQPCVRTWNPSTEGWGSRASGLPKNSSAGFPHLEMGPLWLVLTGLHKFAYLLRVRKKDQIIPPKMGICLSFYKEQLDRWAERGSPEAPEAPGISGWPWGRGTGLGATPQLPPASWHGWWWAEPQPSLQGMLGARIHWCQCKI